jgi:hypothetical protein
MARYLLRQERAARVPAGEEGCPAQELIDI